MSSSKSNSKHRSCDACAQRKISCILDVAASQCDWCKHQGLLCTFNRPFGRRKRKRSITAADRAQDDRATVVEASTNSYARDSPRNRAVEGAEDPAASAAKSTSIPYLSLGGTYFNGIHLGGIASSQGIPFFSDEGMAWIHDHTGSIPSCSRAYPTCAAVQIEDSWELPQREVVDTYLSVFHTSTKRLVFPLIDEESFLDTVEKAYGDQQDTSPHAICGKACVLSFVCVMIHMDGQVDTQQTIKAEQCAARANRMMPEVLSHPSSESLQACTMLCMYHIFSGKLATAATYLSIAYRFLSMLGAHVGQSDVQNNLYLRRVFWHCYMYDKEICIRAGYPPIIDDNHCDLTLPPGYKQIDEFDQIRDGSDLIPGDMRLTIIKSKMIRLLYCAKAFRSPEVQLLKDIMELDDDLESWRMSIPLRYRPSLASSHRISIGSEWNKSKQIHVVVIHFEYYLLLALIHSASGRCRIRAFGEGTHRMSVSSCQALALQASRSTLANLALVAQLFTSGDFWYFVLYPMSASLTIFCNILTSPLNPEAESDLELLSKVPRLIREMCAVTYAAVDNIRLRQIQDFVGELLRLGRLAIDRGAHSQGEEPTGAREN